MEKVFIKTDFIKLDQFLKFENLIESGGAAKAIIADGLVKVNDEICTQRGKKLRNNDVIEYDNQKFIIANEE